MQQKQRNIKEMYETAFQAQRNDRQRAADGKIVYLTFDLEKTLPLPKLSVGPAFYLRQLWLYNSGVHVIYVPDIYRGIYQQLTCSVQNNEEEQQEENSVSSLQL